MLDDYLTKQEEQASEEDDKLKAEEAEVASEENRLNKHPCDCTWGEWGEWSGCSVTCGEGENTRHRKVAINATNGGDECEGSSSFTDSCKLDPCRE